MKSSSKSLLGQCLSLIERNATGQWHAQGSKLVSTVTRDNEPREEAVNTLRQKIASGEPLSPPNWAVANLELPSATTNNTRYVREPLSFAGPNFEDFIGGEAYASSPYSVHAPTWKERVRKPEWLKKALPGGAKFTQIRSDLRKLKLSTVCEEARCPNIGECWGGADGHTATATIMLMGDKCTRGCRFCAVKTSRAPGPLDPDEPENTATAVAAWGIDYVVLTSVDRDDLSDGGASHIAATIRRLKAHTGNRLLVEALVPDFQGNLESVSTIADAGLDVYAHNVETVPRLQSAVRDRRANWKQSISTLKAAKAAGMGVTKTSIMLGCGEEKQEVIDAMHELREHGVDVVTLGQYMRPTKRHMAVAEYVTPDTFNAYQTAAENMGFLYAAAGPMVRSSYRAGEYFVKNVLRNNMPDVATA